MFTWCAGSRHLHVELDGVHAEDGVADVAEHVAGRHEAQEGGQLGQLLQLGLPAPLVGQVEVRAKLDRLQLLTETHTRPAIR